jgi:hypothetical protein
MSRLRTSRFTRLVVIPLTLVALLAGCYKWSPPSQSPADYISQERPSEVRLYLTGGREVLVENPTLTNELVLGLVGDTLTRIPLDQILRLERRSTNIPVVLGITLGSVLVLGAVCRATECVSFDWGGR